MGSFISTQVVPFLFIVALILIFSGIAGVVLSSMGPKTTIMAIGVIALSFGFVVEILPLLACAALGIPFGFFVYRRRLGMPVRMPMAMRPASR
ncbi:hypothetical protein [Actinoalloteichus hymeniacidonis]|uniref:Uncharacterized protein n=1 Tax=Actinoalloteichus hymeniacidonis TaxID=340345 RepID=A0AAC9N149_9PSEU|nr:hypothetical protein [Actinoalloteichus hymeniacidonis]AOS65777.1 hypothetical protein TL08_24995 [Actinoalloteichus hymeniacidonis]MBB5906132.1 uncharacterized membrane protein HdeD (DUF308 family) [Actinoalloteichus hymeniacidonis]